MMPSYRPFLSVSRDFFKSSEGRSWWWILKQITLIIVFQNCQPCEQCPPTVSSHLSYLCHPVSSQERSLNKGNSLGILLSRLRGLLDRREIYGWHFVTINQELLINKVSSLFSWNLGGYENCQTDHFIHYFWLMHPDSLTLKRKKKKLIHYAKS